MEKQSIAANADKSLVFNSSTIWYYSPTPSTNGKLPLLASITVLITISFHLGIMLHFHVVKTTKYSIPPSIEKCTILLMLRCSLKSLL
jgi:hypothetical protein